MVSRKCFAKFLIVFVLIFVFDGTLRVRGRKAKTRLRSLKNLNEQEHFVWQAGKWKDCQMGTSCAEPGFQRLSLSCLDSSRKKTYSRLCNRSKRPSRKRHCVFSACKNQTTFKLRFWPWSPCESFPLIETQRPNVDNKNTTIDKRGSKGFSNANYPNYILESNWRNRVVDTCGSPQSTIVFVKKRNITCIAKWPEKNIATEVSFDDCFFGSEKRPRTVQLCSFGCQQKCVVSFWSEWKTCETCRKKIVYRQREIAFFQNMNNDTKKCPSLLEVNTTKSQTNSSESLYQIRASKWNRCRAWLRELPSSFWNKTANIGFRERSLVCVDDKGNLVKCEEENLSGLPSVKTCIMPRDCHTGPWGEWSDCQKMLYHGKINGRKRGISNQFIRRRTRRIIITNLSGGKPCPHLFEIKLCSPPEIPRYELETTNSTFHNESYEWFSGDFGDCRSNGSDCVSGKKRRHVFCVRRGDTKFNPVGSQFCVHLDKPVEELFCRKPCRQICVLGEWGSWSSCTADCSRNVTGVIRGTHYRVRRVIQYSSDRRACEDYAESRPCQLESCISWMAGTQTVCLMDNIHRTCGNGKTHRAVYCLNSRGRQVKDSLCAGKRPPRSLPCHVPCSDDCVVGTWSDWGPCEGECGKNGTQGDSVQTRRQRILAYPGWSGRPCPANKELRESQSCLGISCGTYHWKAGIWSDCNVPSSRGGGVRNRESQRCFLGRRTRNVTCVNESGKKFQDYVCTDFLKPSVSKECYLCAKDCVLSPWTRWSRCPALCTGLGNIDKPVRKRQRYIIAPGKDGGMPCPAESLLSQTEKCKNCQKYRWRFGDWSKCILDVKGNGKGFKARQVYCVTDADERVEDGYCLDHNMKPHEVMACEGGFDKDCMLTDWSAWSQCSKACGSGNL